MKKLTSLILILCIAFAFAACNFKEFDKIADPATDSDGAGVTDEQQNDIQFGTQDGGTYTNVSFGLTCEFDDAWEIYDADQRAEISGMASETLKDSDIGTIIENSEYFMDLYAANEAAPATVNIVIQKQLTVLSTDKIAEANKTAVESSLLSAGAQNVNVNCERSVFLGKEQTILVATSEANGMKIYQREAFVKSGVYVACITVSSFDTDTTGELLDMFKPIEG